MDDREDDVIRLAEETVTIGTRRIHAGEVEVKTVTETLADTADLLSGGAEVTRTTLGTEVTLLPQIRTEGDVTIVPVLEGFLVVQKRLLLKEEIHNRPNGQTDRFEPYVTLRRQRAVIERTDAVDTSVPSDLTDIGEAT